jgi:hypothetical protein
MGAKFTIVLDTDDPQGLRDALEIATLLNKSHQTFGPEVKASFGKIPLIKLVRDVAKLVEAGKMDSSLRQSKGSKGFVDERWDNWIYRK